MIAPWRFGLALIWHFYLRALALWYVTSRRSGQKPVWDSSRALLLLLPLSKDNNSRALWLSGRNAHAYLHVSPSPRPTRAARPFVAVSSWSLWMGYRMWHSAGEGRFNNVSTTGHLNDSEGSILRSHARRNCLMVLHQFFFVCAWRVPLCVTWWSCLFTRACLLTQIKPGIHHNTLSTGIPNVCAKVRLSWILSAWNYK